MFLDCSDLLEVLLGGSRNVLISPNACGAYFSGAALVCYGAFSFVIKCLEDKYNPERRVGKLSITSTGILIVLIIMKCILVK